MLCYLMLCNFITPASLGLRFSHMCNYMDKSTAAGSVKDQAAYTTLYITPLNTVGCTPLFMDLAPVLYLFVILATYFIAIYGPYPYFICPHSFLYLLLWSPTHLYEWCNMTENHNCISLKTIRWWTQHLTWPPSIRCNLPLSIWPSHNLAQEIRHHFSWP